MINNGMRVVAILSPCHLLDGMVLLNLPNIGVDVVLANLAEEQAVNAIVANKRLVSDLGNGQALYSLDLREFMAGVTPNGGFPAVLNDNTNGILLWNNAGKDVVFNANNTLALNIISHR